MFPIVLETFGSLSVHHFVLLYINILGNLQILGLARVLGVNSIDINFGPKSGLKIGLKCKIENTVLKLD